ncbi:transmembrane protein 70, mitochondrial [Centroberyx gerrardi]|uniref:transmembrane protein 70, mitochondrial n=1 Tax=Centroberyx gerrardi TaxID=166262 RepID=UPI003AB0A235
MFPLTIIRRIRPCIVSQSFNNIHITAARHRKPFSVACFRGATVNQQRLHVVRRSFLSLTSKAESRCPSSRCLSTSLHAEEGNLVYSGNLGNAVRGVKMFSYTSSGFSLCLMPYLLFQTGLGIQSPAMQVAFCGIIGVFTFLTPVLLHLITKGYVVRLYHDADGDTYTAVTYSVLLTEKKTVFHQKQVRIPEVSKMFTTFYAGKTGLLVNPELFPFPHDYNHLMGYDQPFRFDTGDLERPDKS